MFATVRMWQGGKKLDRVIHNDTVIIPDYEQKLFHPLS